VFIKKHENKTININTANPDLVLLIKRKRNNKVKTSIPMVLTAIISIPKTSKSPPAIVKVVFDLDSCKVLILSL